jgi:hypothetical protein
MTKLSLEQQIHSLEAQLNQMLDDSAPIEDVGDMFTRLNKLKKQAGIKLCTFDNPIPGHVKYWQSEPGGRITFIFCFKCREVVESESLLAEVEQMNKDDTEYTLRLFKENYEMTGME